VLIGRNGTGKSNVLEALTIIFRDLLKGEKLPSIKYRIAYEIRDRWVFIDADQSRKDAYQAKTISKSDQPKPYPVGASFDDLAGTSISRAKLVGEESEHLPRFMFGYYSGESERMKDVFRAYLKGYDDKLIKNKDPGLKRMFFAEPVHSNFVLLSFIVNNKKQTDKFLQEQLALRRAESNLYFLSSSNPIGSTKMHPEAIIASGTPRGSCVTFWQSFTRSLWRRSVLIDGNFMMYVALGCLSIYTFLPKTLMP
jgi:hypothetical protein